MAAVSIFVLLCSCAMLSSTHLTNAREEHRLEEFFKTINKEQEHILHVLEEGTPRKQKILGESFKLYFENRSQVLEYFDEGDGHLTTGGSSACMRPDHLEYNATLPGCDCHGLKIRMDNKSATCSHDVQISTGHLASKNYYSYGDFEIRTRTAHSPSGGDPPKNAFSCFSAYVGSREATQHYHNEIALCWPGDEADTMHAPYWYGKDEDRMHFYSDRLGFDSSQMYHTYSFKWRENSITFFVDGEVAHTVNGTKETLPFEPLSIRIILRPDDYHSVYFGDCMYGVEYVSYTAA